MKAKLDALLIVPPFKYANLESAGPACPHLGIASIAAVLEKQKYKVKIIDFFAETPKNEDEVIKKIKENPAKIIGITAVTAEFPQAMKFADLVKQTSPQTTTILGGPHVTIMPETALSENIDYVVIGEGEETIVELADFLIRKKGQKSKIKGIGYKTGKKMHINPSRPLIKDINTLPFPAYHLLPMDKYRPYAIYDVGRKFTSLITSRGCPFRCTYCTSSSVFGHQWRSLTPENVIKLIKYLHEKFNITHFYLFMIRFELRL